MIARRAKLRAANALIIFQIGKTAAFGANANAFRKNTGEKQRIVPDVRANMEVRPLIRALQCSEHFKKIFQWIGRARSHALRAFRSRKIRQHFSDVIGDLAVFNSGSLENVPDENVKIKMAGYTQATASFEDRAKKRLVVEDH